MGFIELRSPFFSRVGARYCAYGTKVVPGDFYCGHGSCNIFGCNCDGGCRKGPYNETNVPHWAQEIKTSCPARAAGDWQKSMDDNDFN